MHAKFYPLFFILFPCASMAAQTLNDLGENKSIYIKREGQNKTAVRLLKQQREMCIVDKQMMLQTKKEDPRTWRMLQATLKQDRPGYNVEAPLSKEPDWGKMMLEIEEEYFQGDQYAKYITSTGHELIDDGTCGFKDTQSKNAEIDTGKYRYDLNFDDKYAEKFPSPVVIDKQYNAELNATMQQNPMLMEVMKNMASGMNTPQMQQTLGEVTKVTGQDKAAGQACDYVGPAIPTKLCYWKTMHEYPTVMKRALIIKSIVSMGQDQNVSAAVKFTRTKKFDPNVFSVPKGFKIESQM